MKKLLLIAAAVLTLSAVSVAQVAEKNFARNPQFLELKNKNADVPEGKLPEPWYVTGGYKALPEGCGVSTTEKPEGYEGNSYAVTGNIILTQSSLAVKPGKKYSVSCMVKTAGTAASAQVRLQLIWLDKSWRELMVETTDANGKVQKNWNHKWVWVKAAPEWKMLEIKDFEAPANAKYAKIRIGKQNCSEKGTAWFADVKMTEVMEEKAE